MGGADPDGDGTADGVAHAATRVAAVPASAVLLPMVVLAFADVVTATSTKLFRWET